MTTAPATFTLTHEVAEAAAVTEGALLVTVTRHGTRPAVIYTEYISFDEAGANALIALEAAVATQDRRKITAALKVVDTHWD